MQLARSTAGKTCKRRAELAHVHTCTRAFHIEPIWELCVSCDRLRPTTVVQQQIRCSFDAADLNLSLR